MNHLVRSFIRPFWPVLLLPLVSVAGPVNINTADAETIARELKGIGAARAAAIVDYRAKHGPFKTADELHLVKGVGLKVIEKNRADIRLERPKTAAAVPPAR